MQLLVVLAALMGVVFSVRAAAVLPLDDRSPVHISRVSVMPFLFLFEELDQVLSFDFVMS